MSKSPPRKPVSPIRSKHEVVAPPTPPASVEPSTATGIPATGSAGVESVSDAAGEVEPEAPSAVADTETGGVETVEALPVVGVREEDPVLDAASSAVMRAHPAADLFPMLGDEQLAELTEDIRVRGLVESIITITVDGEVLILDGRNRYRACLVAGVDPRTVAWDGTGGSPSGFVLAKNIHRRHLSPSQRAAIAVDLLPMLEAEARERQVAAAEATNARAHLALVEGVPEPSSEPLVRGRSRDIAASALGVSGRSVGDAKAIAEAAPEVLVEVKAGNLSIPEGRRIAALPSLEERKEAIKDAKGGTGTRKERVPKTVVAPPSGTDTLGPVRAAVGSLGKLLDAVPKVERPIWWAPLRKAIRVVAK
jgi:ParB-like chromosome segregation protein Spo0J